MAGSSKGITLVAKLLNGKQVVSETEAINKSVEGTGAAVKDADEEAGKAGGGYELFAAKQKKALEKADKEHESFLSKASGRASSMLSGATGMILGGGAAYGLYDSLKAGAQASAIETSLSTVLKNTGQLHGNTMREITSATARAATHGGFAQREQLEGITQLTTETDNSSLALKLNESATNLARGAHLEYSAALKMEAMGVTGSTGRLQKYLGIIQPVKTAVNEMTEAEKKNNKPKLEAAELADKQATARKVQGLIEQKYGGATAAYNKTAAAQLSNFKNSIKLLTEDIGKGLLPVGSKFLGFLLKTGTFVSHSKAALIGLGTVVGSLTALIIANKIATMAQSVASGVAAVKLFLFGSAATATTPATTGLAGAIGGLDLTMGLMAIGFVAAGVVVYEIATHFQFFKKVAVEAVDFVAHKYMAFLGFFIEVPAKLRAAGRGMWDFLKMGFKTAIDWILSGWNKLHFKMPGIHTPFGSIGGFDLGLPHIPLLYEGGTTSHAGLAIVGDRGPELLSLPVGARVDPLTPGQRPQLPPGTWQGSGHQLVVVCQIDRREVARAVVDEIDREFARGNR